MKKRTTQSIQNLKPLTTERLCEIWEKILSNHDAIDALSRLGDAGFPISHLQPRDATFKQLRVFLAPKGGVNFAKQTGVCF